MRTVGQFKKKISKAPKNKTFQAHQIFLYLLRFLKQLDKDKRKQKKKNVVLFSKVYATNFRYASCDEG
jgi:hypothetical protein